MKEYSMELCGDNGIDFSDFCDQLRRTCTYQLGVTKDNKACKRHLLTDRDKWKCSFHSAEAKGIALAYEVSKELGHKEFIVARKSTKSYMKDVVSASVHSITTAGEQHLYLDGKDADKIRGKRVCLLDDVISTGESLHALECLMANASAEVVKKAAILAEGDAADRKDIVFLQKLPLFKKTGDGEYEVIE